MRAVFSSVICLFLLIGTADFAHSQNLNRETNYNLPPGYRLKPNQVIFDLSHKIEGNTSIKDLPESKLQVLKQISEDELLETSTEYQEYVQKGKEYIHSLSPTAKAIYTETELWYIYAFDQKLKIQLSHIQ